MCGLTQTTSEASPEKAMLRNRGACATNGRGPSYPPCGLTSDACRRIRSGAIRLAVHGWG
jgi:hypothetical protein